MEKSAQNIDFTEGAIGKKLFLFVLPILAGNILQQLYTTADAVIIGKHTGKIGLAAIDSVHALLRLPVLFFTGFATGAAVIISQYYGAKENGKLAQTIQTSLLFALAGGLVLSAAGFFAAPYVLNSIAVPQDLYPFALTYVQIYFAGFAGMMLYNIGSAILRALGDSKTPLYILIGSCVLNIVLDLIFIVYLKWNILGAAAATAVSQALSAAAVCTIVIKSKFAGIVGVPSDTACVSDAITGVPASMPHKHKIECNAAILKRIVQLGFPVGIQSAVYPLANLFIQSSINATGTDNIAAWALCGKMDFLVWIASSSLASAVSVFSAQNYGAHKFGRIKRGTLYGALINVCTIAIISAVLYLYGGTLAKLFISASDYNIIPITVRILHFIAPFYVCDLFGDLFAGTIRGTGKTFTAMLITLISACGTRIAWILFAVSHNNDLLYILASFPLSWVLNSLAISVYYVIYARKNFRNMTAAVLPEAVKIKQGKITTLLNVVFDMHWERNHIHV